MNEISLKQFKKLWEKVEQNLKIKKSLTNALKNGLENEQQILQKKLFKN